jgi:hypothetical protein
MDPATQQFLVTQMQLIQNPTATISKHSSLAKKTKKKISHHQQHHQHRWASIRNS